MFYDKIGESCVTNGTGTFSLTRTAYGNFRTWNNGPATGTDAFYLATNSSGSIWELGYGTYTTGSPDTLTRTLIASSTGSLINWVTTPYQVYSAPVGVVLKHMLAGLVNGVANVPLWLPAGAKWWDYTLGIATAWIKKTYVSGTRTSANSHMDEGRAYLGLSGGIANLFSPSPRRYWVDKGAANYTITADDIGKVFTFDITSANRVPTLPANGTTGIGHGFAVGLYGYGSTSYALTLTPDASDAIDTGSAGATRSLPGETLVWVEWDGAKSKWRTRFNPPATVPRGHIGGLGTSRASATTLTVAAGMCTDSTGAAIINLASALTKSTAGAFAAGNNQNGMGKGLTIANSTWYHAYAFVPSGTVAVNGVYAGDVYFDTSASGANTPTGALYFRRIGSFKTNGSAQIVAYVQDGDLFQWDSPSTPDYATANPGTSAVTITSNVPTGVRVEAVIVPEVTYASSGHPSCWKLSDLAVADTAPSRSTGPYSQGGSLSLGGGITPATPPVLVMTNTSAQYRFRTSASAASDSFAFLCTAWRDTRGKDA